MSNYKEGEGVYRFKPIVFACAELKPNSVYEVLVLSGCDMHCFEWNKVDQGTSNDDVHVVSREDGQFELTIPGGFFYTHYVDNHDIIIRVDGRTVLMLPNIERIETDE